MNPVTVDPNQLAAFGRLMAERYVDRTVTHIGIGRPVVDKQLAELSLLLRDDSFTRTRLGVRPTELADPVRASLATLEAALGRQCALRPERSSSSHVLRTGTVTRPKELGHVAVARKAAFVCDLAQ